MRFSDRRARFLAQQCFSRARGGRSREDFLRQRVQVSTPFERIVVAGGGLLLGTLAVWAFLAAQTVLAVLLGVMGGILLIVGARGRRRTVEVVFRGLDGAITERILDALF